MQSAVLLRRSTRNGPWAERPHSEAIAVARVFKALNAKVEALRGRRFSVVTGVEPPAEPPPPPPPPRAADADIVGLVTKAMAKASAELSKAQRTDMEAHVAASAPPCAKR